MHGHWSVQVIDLCSGVQPVKAVLLVWNRANRLFAIETANSVEIAEGWCGALPTLGAAPLAQMHLVPKRAGLSTYEESSSQARAGHDLRICELADSPSAGM